MEKCTSPKRNRDTNYTPKEEAILVSLVKKYEKVVENKTTNAASKDQKDKVWQVIQNEFNCKSETRRDAVKLKNKYFNLKKKTRKDYGDYKCYIKKTGGGPAKSASFSVTQEVILEMLGTQVTGLPSNFDDDQGDLETEEVSQLTANSSALSQRVTDSSECLQLLTCSSTPFQEATRSSTSTNLETASSITAQRALLADAATYPLVFINEPQDESTGLPIEESVNTTDDSVATNNWGKLLTQKKSDALKVNTKNKEAKQQKINKQVIEWAEKKTHLAELQHKVFEEEWTLKKKHLKEVHALTLKNIIELHEMNKKIAEEEWQIRKEALILQNQIQLQTLHKNK